MSEFMRESEALPQGMHRAIGVDLEFLSMSRIHLLSAAVHRSTYLRHERDPLEVDDDVDPPHGGYLVWFERIDQLIVLDHVGAQRFDLLIPPVLKLPAHSTPLPSMIVRNCAFCSSVS